MKRILTLMSIGLLVTVMAVPTSLAMGRAKKTCECPEGKCVCAAKEATACTKCPEGECKCAPKEAACTKCPEGECKCEKK